MPLRPALLNENGPALAGFVLAVLAISLAAGAIFAGKSGWCATWCPVLPVERLYGQDPLVSVTHAHCATCSACVRSCYDLKPQHSLDALLGRSASSILRTPTGVFAAGFPGFVVGYFTRPATAGLAMTYVWIAACVAGAVLALSLAQRVGQLRSASIARLAAALAAAAYYWFTVPDTARAAHALLHIPPASPAGITIARVLFLFLPGIWLLSARHRAGRDASIQGART